MGDISNPTWINFILVVYENSRFGYGLIIKSPFKSFGVKLRSKESGYLYKLLPYRRYWGITLLRRGSRAKLQWHYGCHRG